MHQIQIHIIDIELGEGLFESFHHTMVMGITAQRTGYKHIATREFQATHGSLVVTKISLRGIPDSRMAFPTRASLSAGVEHILYVHSETKKLTISSCLVCIGVSKLVS